MATPSPGSRAYAEQLEEISGSVLALLEGCSPREWRSAGPDGGACVGDLARSLSLDLAEAWELLTAAGPGAPRPRTMVDPGRVPQTSQAAPPTSGEAEATLTLLRPILAALGEVIADLSEEQLTGATAAERAAGRGASAKVVVEVRVLGALREALGRMERARQHTPRTPGGVGRI